MLKLNVGTSKKIGQPDFGSRGATVAIEQEFDSQLIGDPDEFAQRIRQLFEIAKAAVDRELDGQTSTDTGNGRSAVNARPSGRPATASQARAIRAIADRLRLDADGVARGTFGRPVDELSLRDASQLIDDLKSRKGNGGSR